MRKMAETVRCSRVVGALVAVNRAVRGPHLSRLLPAGDEIKVTGKRTTKLLRLFSLSKTERCLTEVSHKCFFPGRKYGRIKVSLREKAQGEPRG